jgi:antitoxin PrlF
MPKKTYKASWAKIGNSSGYRLSGNFFKENPQFSDTNGTVQVIDADTILIRREQTEVPGQDEDELLLGLFLDFAMRQALSGSEEVEAYTESMSVEDDELITGVKVGGD